MAVVINEMEVVSEPPASSPGSSGGKDEGRPSASGVQQAHNVERALERHRQRRERVRAH